MSEETKKMTPLQAVVNADVERKILMKESEFFESQGKFLLIYICNFHVLSNLLLIYICKLHWNLNMKIL